MSREIDGPQPDHIEDGKNDLELTEEERFDIKQLINDIVGLQRLSQKREDERHSSIFNERQTADLNSLTDKLDDLMGDDNVTFEQISAIISGIDGVFAEYGRDLSSSAILSDSAESLVQINDALNAVLASLHDITARLNDRGNQHAESAIAIFEALSRRLDEVVAINDEKILSLRETGD